MIGVEVAALGIFVIHITFILRAITLEGREPYARAAWLFLLIALPGLGVFFRHG